MIEYGPPDESGRRQQDMQQRYRNVFGSEEGRAVLGDILVTCHFGVPLNNDAERIEYNVGISIARMSGLMGDVDRMMGLRPAAGS